MPDIVAVGFVAGGAVAGILLSLLVGYLRGRSRSKDRMPKSDLLGQGRVEILESTVIDDDRRLVLIRCDKIEHLVMVGGSQDVVVENDVRKVRGSGSTSAANPMQAPRPTASAALAANLSGERSSASSQRSNYEPERKVEDAPRTPGRASEAREPRVDRAPSRSASGNTNGARPSIDVPTVRTPAGSDAQRRDPAPRRSPQLQPTQPLRPAADARSGESVRALQAGGDRAGAAARLRARDPDTALPAAKTPWPDNDSLENDIVRALRVEPERSGSGTTLPARREAAPRAKIDTANSLGDLADRLEEALAREVSSASVARRNPAPGNDDFAFDNGNAPAAPVEQQQRAALPARSEARERIEARERTEPRERSEARDRRPERPALAAPASPEPEPRREEAPVISLNARRRESADALEDEMARLLGELTSDSKAR